MIHTVDGRNSAPPGMVLKPCRQWDKLATSTGDRRISEPSTVLQVWIPGRSVIREISLVLKDNS